MDIGRNDPCPCGSGKKYKRCCGAASTDSLELAAAAIRAVQDSADAKIVRLVRDEFGDAAFGDAWIEFDLTEGDLDVDRNDEADLFGSWLFYDWEPWEPDRHELRPREIRFTPAAGAIAGRGTELSPAESDFLLRVVMTPTSFHEVMAIDSECTVTLRDLFLGTEIKVFENLASTDVQPGDIAYGRVVEFDDIGLMVGAGQWVFPPGTRQIIPDAKRALRRRPGQLDASKLCREEPLLRSLYFQLRHELLRPHAPASDAAAKKRESKRERAARQRDEELQALPEVQAMIGKMTADHYSTWPDVPVPALRGKTPRAAMQTAEGRERVEALVASFERQQSAGRVPPYDFNQLRAMMGLPVRSV